MKKIFRYIACLVIAVSVSEMIICNTTSAQNVEMEDNTQITQQELQQSPVEVGDTEKDSTEVILYDLNANYEEKLKTLYLTTNATSWKYKTKNVYSKATGKQVATFTIQYSTKIQSGRTVFDEVGIDLQFINNYRGTYECTKATGDVVEFKVDYNLFGIDQGYTNVSFMP